MNLQARRSPTGWIAGPHLHIVRFNGSSLGGSEEDGSDERICCVRADPDQSARG
jgi:hypothetical protein